jgi:hypothetical protein
VTVIGKHPQYLKIAQRLRANVFNIPMEEWIEIGKEGGVAAQIAVNLQFLDEAIARGDYFLLATSLNRVGQKPPLSSKLNYNIS